MPVLAGIDNTVLLLCASIAIVVCIAAGLLLRRRRAGLKIRTHVLSAERSRAPLKVQKIPASIPGSPSDPVAQSPAKPRPRQIDCLSGRADLGESLQALAEKYSLEDLTLATADGLLLASSGKKPSADTVARYAGMYAENVQPRPPGIMLFGLEYKGSPLVGIAKTRDLYPQEPEQDLISETKDILNRWI
ncbi:hypothetical protein [Methanoregula sp.]|uniref:hypothetical protein n=1 Tax=Methanoregula sp. TaxID=2052170 RepID=UPI002C2C004C|nr:hypothetical protein [Methanoregula sp.]HVP97212.1 hypothetical protein [Methanoregula sp.]